MMFTVIYVDKNDGIKKWKRSSDPMSAIKVAADNCNGDYEICVSLYEYGKLEEENKRIKNTLEQKEVKE